MKDYKTLLIQYKKLLKNLDRTSKLLPSKNEIHYHKWFDRVCLIEWE